MDDCLPRCRCPVLVMHGDHDPVVAVKSAKEIMEKLETGDRQLKIIASNRHGILMENIGGTWDVINDFMTRCTAKTNDINVGPTSDLHDKKKLLPVACGCETIPKT